MPAGIAQTPTGLAGLMDDLSGAPALGTGLGGLGHAEGGALSGAHGAAAVAVGADLRRGTGGAAAAAAVRAGLDAAVGDLLFTAEGRFLKADIRADTDIVAPARRVGIASGAAAEAEDIAEEVAQIPEIPEAAAEAAESAAAEARVGVEGRVTELVIFLALLLVGEHLVGLVGLLEALLAFLVAGVQVGMVLPGDFAVGFFDLIGRGALVHAQDLIIISLLCHK